MTLIAVTSNFGYPIMLGDILTTSETIENEVAIPTFLGGVNHRLPDEQKFLPYNLRRKIYVLSDQMAVGLAGYEYEMKLFLDELKNYFKYKSLSEGNIQEFLKEFGIETFPNCAAIILFADKLPEGVLISYHYFGIWNHLSSSVYGDVLACGSGSSLFLEQAAIEWTTPLGPIPDGLFRAISSNYTLLANILGQERLSLATIKKYWGAGFEMIYYDGERFQKMDDITIVLWRGTLNVKTGEYEVNPFLFLNYQYSSNGEILLINADSGSDRKAYGVLPIYMKKEDIDEETLPKEAHFDARKICCSYILEVGDRQEIGFESFAQVVAPSFYTETDPKAEPSFLPPGEDNYFNSNGPNGEIYNLGLVKIDIRPDGRLAMFVQEGVTEQVIESMRQVLIAKYGLEG